MKKKKIIPMLILVGVLAVFSTLYVVLRNHNKNHGGEEETSATVIEQESSSVTELSYTYNNKTLTFVRDYEGWYYKDDKDFPLDTSYIETILSDVSSLSAQRELENAWDNLGEYGLDKPSYSISLTDSDGITTTLYIGDENVKSGNYYCYPDGEKKVYMIASTLVEDISHDLNSLMTLEDTPSITESTVYDVVIGKRHFKYYANSNEDYDYTDTAKWFEVNSDKSLTPLDSVYMRNLIGDISSISYSKCVNYNVNEKKLDEYGLDNPVRLALKYTENETTASDTDDSTEETTATKEVKKEFVIYIGSKDSDGNYYTRTEGSSCVNVVAASTFENCLNINEEELLYQGITDVTKGNIESLIVNVNGKKYELIRDGELTDDKYEEAYSALTALSGEKAVTDNTEIKDVSITLSYKLKDEKFKNVTIKFAKYNGSYYVADISDNRRILVVNSEVDDFVALLEN